MSQWRSDNDRDMSRYEKKYFSQHHLARQAHIYLQNYPKLKPRLCGERPTTNILSHGTTFYKEMLNKLCIIR
jgi:hypothetical protein